MDAHIKPNADGMAVHRSEMVIGKIRYIITTTRYSNPEAVERAEEYAASCLARQLASDPEVLARFLRRYAAEERGQ